MNKKIALCKTVLYFLNKAHLFNSVLDLNFCVERTFNRGCEEGTRPGSMRLCVVTKLCSRWNHCYYSIYDIDLDRKHSYSRRVEMEPSLGIICLSGKCSCHLQNQYASRSSLFSLEFLSDTFIFLRHLKETSQGICLKFIFLSCFVLSSSFNAKLSNVKKCYGFIKFSKKKGKEVK